LERLTTSAASKLGDAGLERLSSLPLAASLQHFYFHGAALSDAGLAHLKRFKTLYMLAITNGEFSQAGTKHLRQIPTLINLQFSTHARINDQAVAELRGLKLTSLIISGQGITDAGIKHLLDIPTLELLAFYDTSVGDEGIKALKALPALAHL